jgi:hypothetical protein
LSIIAAHRTAVTLIGLIAACASGCASGPEPLHADFAMQYEEIAKLQNKKSCCEKLSDLNFHKIKPSTETQFLISDESPVFPVNGNKTYVYALVLPTEADGATVVLKSFVGSRPQGRGLAPQPLPYLHIMRPHMTFLDAGFKPTRSVSPGVWSPHDRQLIVKTTVQTREKYVLVHTTAGELSNDTRTTHTIMVSAGGILVPITKGQVIRHMPVGSLSLTVGATD